VVLSFLRADLKDEKYRAMEKAGWGGGLLLVLLVFFTNSDAKISMLHYAGEAPSSFTLNIIQT